MRYTIHGYSQRQAVELGLKGDDLMLLRWLSDFSNTGKMEHKEINGSIFYWVNYQTVCDDLPILVTKKDTLYRMLKKLCDAKVLKHKTVKINGTFSYYGFDVAFHSLLSDDLQGGYGKKSVGGTEKNPIGVRKKIRNKDLSIINSSIKETHTANSNNSQNLSALKDLCVEIENILGEKISQKKVQQLINESSIEVVKQYIYSWDKYKSFARQGQAPYFIHCIQHQMPVPTPSSNTYNNGKIPQYMDFEQREYKEEDMKKFYSNLNYNKPLYREVD